MKKASQAVWKFINYPIVAVVLAIYLLPYLLLLPHSGQNVTTSKCTGDRYTHYSYYDGKRFEIAVSLSRLADTPSWDPEAEQPPLAPGQAVSIARTALAKVVPNPQEWRRQNVSLLTPGHINKYYYLIQFAAPPHHNGPNTTSGAVDVAVLLDGQPVEPKPDGA